MLFDLPLHQIENRITRRSLNLCVVLFAQKIIPQRLHVRQSLQHHIAIVIVLDVVQPDKTRTVQRTVNGSGRFRCCSSIETRNHAGRRKCRIEQILNIVQRRINDLVIVGQTIELEIVQIEEHMMGFGYGMRVRMRLGAATLEVFAANEAGVHIDACQRDGAQFLKVKVEQMSIDGVQIGAETGLCWCWRCCCSCDRRCCGSGFTSLLVMMVMNMITIAIAAVWGSFATFCSRFV